MAISFSKKGFTLIELLISLGIITVITGMMLANFRGGQQHNEVRFASEILVNQIREVQTNSLSGRLVNICIGGSQDQKICGSNVTCPGGICERRVPLAYGIHMSFDTPTEYQIYFDTDGDFRMDPDEVKDTLPYVSTVSVELVNTTAPLPVDIAFKPPFAQIFINGAAAGPAEVVLTLKHKIGNQSRDVSINRITGKIEHN